MLLKTRRADAREMTIPGRQCCLKYYGKTTSRVGGTLRTRSKCSQLLSANFSKHSGRGGCVQKLKNKSVNKSGSHKKCTRRLPLLAFRSLQSSHTACATSGSSDAGNPYVAGKPAT